MAKGAAAIGRGGDARAAAMSALPEVSVVIPAHNEERVIARCLAALLDGLEPGQAEIVVVCNGCTDATAAIARQLGPAVHVDELPVASKAAALNRGDDLATAYPRVYIDADIEMRGRDLLMLARALHGQDGPLAGAPELRVEASERPWGVRSYYRVWTRTAYVTQDLIGSGVYGLSAAGRRRFGRFPTIIADDLFVYRQFEPGERIRLAGATFVVRPPATLRDLLRVQGRRRAGVVELGLAFPGLDDRTAPPRQGPGLRRLARDPRWWPALVVYGAVVSLGTAKGRWKARFGNLEVWERAERNRISPDVADHAGMGT